MPNNTYGLAPQADEKIIMTCPLCSAKFRGRQKALFKPAQCPACKMEMIPEMYMEPKTPPVVKKEPAPIPTPVTQGYRGLYGGLALLVTVISSIAAWAIILNMRMYQGPGTVLMIIAVLTVLATAVLVAIEAYTVSAENWLTWAICMILFWALVFPLWMSRRKAHGQKSYCVISALAVVIAVASWVTIGNLIGEQNAKIDHAFDALRNLSK